MTRYDQLLAYYHHLDVVTTGLVLLAVWAVSTGHVIDWITPRSCKVIIPIYWSLVIIIYIAGIVFIGLKFS